MKLKSLSEQIGILKGAAKFANRMFPLPRCIHGKALKDHAGDKLFPTCGCSFDGELKKRGLL